MVEHGLTFTVTEEAGRTVVSIAGEIDLATSSSLGECLEAHAGIVVIDLAKVTFIDSSGLGVLVRERKRVRSRSGDLRLRAPQDHVRRVFEVTGLSELLEDS